VRAAVIGPPAGRAKSTASRICTELRERLEAFKRRDLYITHATNGVRFTELERERLRRIRYEGHEQAPREEVTAA
jgi:hypothetical protein